MNDILVEDPAEDDPIPDDMEAVFNHPPARTTTEIVDEWLKTAGERTMFTSTDVLDMLLDIRNSIPRSN